MRNMVIEVAIGVAIASAICFLLSQTQRRRLAAAILGCALVAALVLALTGSTDGAVLILVILSWFATIGLWILLAKLVVRALPRKRF